MIEIPNHNASGCSTITSKNIAEIYLQVYGQTDGWRDKPSHIHKQSLEHHVRGDNLNVQ